LPPRRSGGIGPSEKHGRKRLAELACVYDAAPVPRAPGGTFAPPGKGKGTPPGRHGRLSRSRPGRAGE